MILISHRGNISGRVPDLENTEEYILQAIRSQYFVEIDLWMVSDNLYLGHDDPIYKTSIDFLRENKDSLLIHCKNLEALEFMNNNKIKFRYFYHEYEQCVLTSFGEMVMHSHANKFPKNSIYMLPEILNIKDVYLRNCSGICSDFISNYNHLK